MVIRPIQSDDITSKISLGNQSLVILKTFLKEHSLAHESHLTARTYVLVESINSSRVYGYITVLCSEISASSFPEASDHRTHMSLSRIKSFPALKISMLAVDKALRNQGHGRNLVLQAVRTAILISEVAGCRFIIVDAKESAIPFYEKMGFDSQVKSVVDLGGSISGKPMYLDLYSI